MAHGPHSFSSLGELIGASLAWTFSITMGMFYLCTFLFSKRRAADTEVHLMKNCMYLYLCMCMLCTASCMCSVCVCMCECVNECVCALIDQEQDTATFMRAAKGVAAKWRSRDVFLCPSLCCSFVRLNVVWRILKWPYSAHTFFFLCSP